MPLWLGVLGIDVPFPNFDLTSLVGHLVYGVVLGAMFAMAKR